MAKVDQCGFCKHTTIGICECVIRFGRETENLIKAWKLVKRASRSLLSLKKAMASDKWKMYSAHAEREALRARQEKSVFAYAKKLAEKYERKLNAEVGKKFGEHIFHVTLQPKCNQVPRY